jgi:glycosyltransferase involved in cell wall biosynthesis
MRILVVAYACEPDKGSEPGVGWNMPQGIGRDHELVVLTRASNRAAIEGALAREAPAGLEHARFLYYDTPPALRRYKKGRRGVHVYYLLWQLGAFALALREHRERPFDLVHHLTFGNAWYPSLFGLFPAPFLWGPLGLNPPLPPSLAERLLDPGERLQNRARRWLNGVVARSNPLVWIARERALRLLVANRQVRDEMNARFHEKTLVVPAVGAPAADGAPRRRAAGPLRALAVGQLIGLKGVAIVLHALARLEAPPGVVLTVVGDGPRRADLERLAGSLALGSRARFVGALPQREVLARMAESDVLVFPAFDGGGMVVVEALSRGLPVVCLDVGGPAESVTEEAGVRVPVGGFEETVAGIAAALARIAADDALHARLSAGALRRFEERHSWQRRADELRAVVRDVAAELPRR